MVAVDLGETAEQARRFQAQHELSFPVLIDPLRISSPRFKTGFAVPQNVVLDENMLVRYSGIGFDQGSLKRIVAKLLSSGG